MREILITEQEGRQDQQISEAFQKERGRLWNFIRRRGPEGKESGVAAMVLKLERYSSSGNPDCGCTVCRRTPRDAPMKAGPGLR